MTGTKRHVRLAMNYFFTSLCHFLLLYKTKHEPLNDFPSNDRICLSFFQESRINNLTVDALQDAEIFQYWFLFILDDFSSNSTS